MTDSKSKIQLSGLAQRLQSDARFMSYVLATYQQQEGLETEELARELGTLPGMLLRLALCKRPDPNSTLFVEQVREIADYTLMDEAQLANIIRQVDSLEKLAHRPAMLAEVEDAQPDYSFSGLLAAARDRDESDETNSVSSEDPSNPDN